MTSTLRYAVFSAALIAATVFLSADAFARTSVAAAPAGSIVSVDRENRTLTVRDRETQQTFRVQVPKDAQVAISPMLATGSAVNFEQVIAGMQYRGIR